MKKFLIILFLTLTLNTNTFALTKCQGDNVFDWTDCIGAYIIVDGDYKAIEFNPGDEKKLLNPSFEEIQNFNFGTKYIGEMKNGYADGEGVMLLKTGSDKIFSYDIYSGQFKKDRFNFDKKGSRLRGKHTIEEY
ncbi:hypothetical protein N9A53_04350 [Candidatus Pelagibacter ubique]|jgi:hypothetical protein|nr:hypothetical protein [Candidatus Pelagibacter ubique]